MVMAYITGELHVHPEDPIWSIVLLAQASVITSHSPEYVFFCEPTTKGTERSKVASIASAEI